MQYRQLLLALAIVGALGIGIAFVASVSAGEDVENVTDEMEDDELTLDDLQETGTRYQNSPDSVRFSGDRMMWVVHWPAGLSGNPGDPDDDHWRYLTPGETVDRNEVWLRSIILDEGSETVTVNVAYYDVEEREVHDPETNVTTTEQQATNVVVDDHEIDLQRGWLMAEIPLRQSDDPRHVTMWVEGHEDELRWNFEHQSVATTQELPFSTYGGLLRWALLMLVGPIAIGGIGALAGAKGVVRRTGVGTQYGYTPWLILFGLGAATLVAMFFGQVSGLIVQAPIALAVVVVALIFALALETFDHGVRRVRFIRTDLHGTTSPKGEDAVDHMRESERTVTVIDRDDEPLAVATPGFLPFLSRLFGGGAATLKTVHPEHEDADLHGETNTAADPLQTYVRVEEGRVDKKVFVNTESPEVLDYKAEGWTISPPDVEAPDDRLGWLTLAVKIGALLAVAGAAFQLIGGGAAFLAILGGLVAISLRPVEGYARVWPAPVHYRQARDTAMHLAEASTDAETFEEQQKRLVKMEMQPVEKAFDLLRHGSEAHVDELDSIYGEYHEPEENGAKQRQRADDD